MHLVVLGYLLAIFLKRALAPDNILDCPCPPETETERVLLRIQSHGIIVSDTRRRVLCVYKAFCRNWRHKHSGDALHSDQRTLALKTTEQKLEIVWSLLLRSRYHETFFGIVASDMLLRWQSSSNLLVLSAFCLFGAIEVANVVLLVAKPRPTSCSRSA